MCGICGTVRFDGAPSGAVVEAMAWNLRHRGPDAGGTWSFPSCILGHRRLSILDLSESANQPMISEDGLTALVFNGEIYNFMDLRRTLERKGHRFKTHSDTEVLLELYLDEGQEMTAKLNGMFSLAIWDERKQQLFLARDRLGKKPLYYYWRHGGLNFSSELFSLVQDVTMPRNISEQALFEFFLYDFIPGSHTIFEKVYKLPPASAAVFDREGLRIHTYWRPPEPEETLNYEEQTENLQELLADAVRIRLVSDVPLGSFLSGGLDSTLITSLMRPGLSEKVKTFSISFPGTSHDESAWSAMAASFLGTDHHEYPVDYDIETLFPTMVRHFGEPFGDSSAIPTWHLSRHTRKQVTVALSGDGGDELFGGYERYLARRFQLFYDLLPKALRERVIRPFVERLPATTDYYGTSLTKKLKLFVQAASRLEENPLAVIPRTFSHGEVMNLIGTGYDENTDPVLSTARQWMGLDPVSRMMFTDVQTYMAEDILTKVDRMTMAHALEVRSPLLDYRVVEFACRLPREFKIQARTTKRILRRAARGHVPNPILKRSKYGFQVPLGEWFKGKLRSWAQERLYSPGHDRFNSEFVRRLWDDHQQGRVDNTHRIWLLLVFNEWFAQFGR